MLITKDNYQKNLSLEIEKNKKLIEKLNLLFSKSEYNKISIGSIGNSISSGYSKCDEMMPFLYRSGLQSIECTDLYSYARVRKNEEQNIFKWYTENISHKEINTFLIGDILEKKDRYAHFNQENLAQYQKLAASQEIGFKDFVQLNHNIIIYNGLTGTFTNVLRKGNRKDKLQVLSSFSKDAKFLRAILFQFYLDNPSTQIYVCGIPDVLGLHISSVYDFYIKNAIKAVPNAMFVKGQSRNMASKLPNQIESDIHYNKVEYLSLINRILAEIIDDFYVLPFKGNLLNSLSEYSKSVELSDPKSHGNLEEVNKIIYHYMEMYGSKLQNKKKVFGEIAEYYDENYLTSFPCTDRKKVLKILKEKA